MKKICVNIIIHGFAGGIYEIKPLYDFLRSKNLNVHSILLAGHGKTRKDLSGFSHDDWINSAVEQVKNIIKKYYGGKPETEIEIDINLIGFSMGGLICSHLTDYFKANKIVFANTPVYYWNLKQITGNIIADIRNKDFMNTKHYIKSTVNSPIKALFSFLRVLSLSKKKFSSVCVKRANPLILQCLDDDTVQSRSADFIKGEIGETAKIIYYKTGGHLVFLGETANQACNDIYNYLKS